MGQYQQWLRYQEIDQQMRTRLKELEAEFAQLQEAASLLAHVYPEASNAIIDALAASLELKSLPSLLDWGGLPNFSPQEVQEALPGEARAQSPTTPRPESMPSEDRLGIVGEHGQTEPQLEIPWWLHNLALSSSSRAGALPAPRAGSPAPTVDGRGDPGGRPVTDRTRPLDLQSMRTNRLVQRWIERWGRRPIPTAPVEPREDNAP